LLRSIWFAKEVSITLIGRGDQTYQIAGRVIRVHVSGPVFQQHYVAHREKLGDVDLAAVWVIAPQEIVDDSWQARRRKEEAHPNFVHLDRLVKVQ